jgi:hypothetical protein
MNEVAQVWRKREGKAGGIEEFSEAIKFYNNFIVEDGQWQKFFTSSFYMVLMARDQSHLLLVIDR